MGVMVEFDFLSGFETASIHVACRWPHTQSSCLCLPSTEITNTWPTLALSVAAEIDPKALYILSKLYTMLGLQICSQGLLCRGFLYVYVCQ